ncbi:hypothetical protein HPB50_011112 [Hyalomma asiaticum]|uniref:Uncharacterized protein n=1 Tax=Hyalomma asiaticum TaxID=266040 RepID=A0ACB7SE13_HYAAI|nr:hypothetical protein HPB50_011112 [Hyalomma asiaticum]
MASGREVTVANVAQSAGQTSSETVSPSAYVSVTNSRERFVVVAMSALLLLISCTLFAVLFTLLSDDSVVRYPRLRLYWKPEMKTRLVASDRLSRNRFEKLSNNLHKVEVSLPDINDRFWKVGPFSIPRETAFTPGYHAIALGLAVKPSAPRCGFQPDDGGSHRGYGLRPGLNASP